MIPQAIRRKAALGFLLAIAASLGPTGTSAIDRTLADRPITHVLEREPYRSTWARTFKAVPKPMAWARSPAASVGASRYLKVGRKTYLFVYGAHPKDASLGVHGMFDVSGNSLVALISDSGELQSFFGGPSPAEREGLLESFGSD